MNPLFREFLESILKKALTSVAALLVGYGWITPEQSDTFVLGLIAFLISLGWSAWTDYKDRLKLLVAQALPAGVTETQVEAAVAAGNAPAASTAKDVAPTLKREDTDAG